ncbi:LysR family transcriptional regulator [Rhodanobacter aciditrophus]|uniref:LysR family transcriptional regulator n=1 Tax=Rhodanobacter aciditrophus TaxID=1623218 RepID=UPI003CF55116
MNPELRYLPAFRAVCEAGSLRAAAAAMHRSEQAVGYQLKRLEETLGMPLFERGSGPLTPNAAGLRLLAFCRDMRHDWRRIGELIGAPSPGGDPLRIATVSGYGRYALLPLFHQGPLAGVSLRLRYPLAEEVIRSVESGDADLGFLHRQVASTRLVVRAVDREELVLISAPAHPAPALADLAGAEFVTYDESEDVFACWFGQAAGAALPRLRSGAHFEELEEVLDWVAAGRGLSIVPMDCARESASNGRLVVHRPEGRRCFNPIYAIYDAAAPHPLAQRVLDAVAARSAA